MLQLSASQARVVGSLIEKQLTTPQQYPLTLNALVLACNQSSNRDPVVAHAEDEVAVVLDQLKEQRLVRFVLPSHGRSVVRYRHVLDEALGIDQPQLAVLAVLLLRGPQTVGELRIRTDRMASFESLGQVQHELDLLAGLEEALVACQPRRPGQKEERWTELLSGPPAPDVLGTAAEGRSPAPVDAWPVHGRPVNGWSSDQVGAAGEPPPPGVGAATGAVGSASGAAGPVGPSSSSAAAGDVVAELRQGLAGLAADVVALRVELQELRDSLGG